MRRCHAFAPQDFRPLHVHGALEDRISSEARVALDRVFISEQYNYNMALRAPAAESMNLVFCTLAIPCFISLPCVALWLENGQFGNGKETQALVLRPAGEGDEELYGCAVKARAVCHSPGHEARFGLPTCYGCDFALHPAPKNHSSHS